MYEIDFLPVGRVYGQDTRAGDAITVRFTVEADRREAIVVLCGGHIGNGANIVEHVTTIYDSNAVDLLISTHAGTRHLAAMATVVDRLDVAELLVHQPRRHGAAHAAGSGLGDLDALERLLDLARSKGTAVTEPFTGVFRFDDQVSVLGPTQTAYMQVLGDLTADRRHSLAANLAHGFPPSPLHTRAASLVNRALARARIETLTDNGYVDPSSDLSVVTLIRVGEHRLLFTGDVGMPGLEQAVDFYESWYGEFAAAPVHFFQAPHHGSADSVGPTLLSRILGSPGTPHREHAVSFVSAPQGDEQLPSPKVVYALRRRGCEVGVTQGRHICHSFEAPPRPTWMALAP